jgi:hypothetical protein
MHVSGSGVGLLAERALVGLPLVTSPGLERSPAPARDSMGSAIHPDGSLSTRAKVVWGVMGGVMCTGALIGIIVGALR